MHPAALTVLIVDEDIGFLFWLGDIFTEAGCQSMPALGCQEAVSLANRLGIEPDLIVLNPFLPGIAGMLQDRIVAKRHPKIVSIGAPPKAVAAAIGIHAILDRPDATEPISRRAWLERVRKLLGDYKRSN